MPLATEKYEAPPEPKATPRQEWQQKCHIHGTRLYQQILPVQCHRQSAESSRLRNFKLAGCEVWEALPPALQHIRRAIEDARSLLDLENDWDEDGAVAIDAKTWRRAAILLTECARRVWDRYQRSIVAPDITPVPDGSIDLDWHLTDYELLVNIPSDPNGTVGYYGNNRGRNVVEGRQEFPVVHELLTPWLGKAICD